MHIILEILYTFAYLLYCIGDSIVRLFVPVRKKSFAGKVALITGAGHGIGRELALKFHSVGARLVLLDINKDNLTSVVKEIKALGAHSCSSYVCDVSKIDAVKSTLDKVQNEVGDVDVLVNNAGILHGVQLLKLTEDEIRRTFDVNLFAIIWTCRHILPSMIARNEGHIINIASASAFRGVAYLVDYSSSKHAVKGFTEALTDEMEREGHTGINFTCVYPMFVNTGLVHSMNDRTGRILTPKEVAEAVVEGAQRNYKSVYIPAGLDWMISIGRLLPKRFVEEPPELMRKGIDPQR